MVDITALLKADLDDDHRNTCETIIGGQKIVMYSTDLTGADIEWVTKRHPKFIDSPSLEATVDLIIRKAQDEEGTRIFDASHKPMLLRMKVSWLSDVRARLFKDDGLDFQDEALETASKN